MPINYVDPTGIRAQLGDYSTGGAGDRLFSNLNREWSGGGGGSAMDQIRSNLNFDDRIQSYSIEDIIKGITGGNQAQSDAIISNFITTQGSPLNMREHFFSILEQWETALPLNNMWLVFFTVPDIVRDEVMGAWGEHVVQLAVRNKEGPAGVPMAWWKQMSGRVDETIQASNEELEGGTNLARRRLLEPDMFTKVFGCAFAQTVTIPQEQVQTAQLGIPGSRGFLRTPVITHRQPFASLNIEFLETNISFVDFLLRPWTVLSGHLGSVARKESLVTDVMIINFSRAGFSPEFVNGGSSTTGGYVDEAVRNKRGFIPRKIWIFNGCQPITIDSQRHTYGADAPVERRTIEWMFRRYQCYLPPEFEGLFDSIHGEESSYMSHTAVALHEAGIAMAASTARRASAINNEAKGFWEGKDGAPNPLDNPDINAPKGDGVVRGFPARHSAKTAALEAEAEADFYWQGYDKQYGDTNTSGGGKWTVDGRGYDRAPPFLPVPGKGNAQEVGWDKEADGESRKLRTERPYGYPVTNWMEGLIAQQTESSKYGAGFDKYNPYRSILALNRDGRRYGGLRTKGGLPSARGDYMQGDWETIYPSWTLPDVESYYETRELNQPFGGDAASSRPWLYEDLSTEMGDTAAPESYHAPAGSFDNTPPFAYAVPLHGGWPGPVEGRYKDIQTQLPQLRGGILERILNFNFN